MKKQLFFLAPLFWISLASQSMATEEIYDPCIDKKGIKKCQCYAAQAKSYEDKMRAGYSAKDYNKLEASRRYFNDRAFHCKSR